MKQTGYKMKEYGIPTKRYCQTLDLKDDPELISEYRKRHTENEAWPEILQGIRSVATLPRQEEWETYMSIFQVARPGATSAEKWRMMERIFHLY